MAIASRSFQVFVKPIGAVCNLGCAYCYYLKHEHPFSGDGLHRMPMQVLETYIVQHIRTSPDREIRFSWHGGEPTLLGYAYFQNIVAIQRRYRPTGKKIINGIQTNGTLLSDPWCRFLAREGFSVGLSLDGPGEMHDRYRKTRDGHPTHALAIRGYQRLRAHGITPDILCVLNAHNVNHPDRVYGFFKEIEAKHIGFLPLVEFDPRTAQKVSPRSVPAEAFGHFLCAVFDAWQKTDIGTIKVQLFEETARAALGEEHELCILRKTCGDVPVLERDGALYACDHFVDRDHLIGHIQNSSLAELLADKALTLFGQGKWDNLPRYCRECEFLALCHGECPKNRFIKTPDGQDGLNYLCAGYKRFFRHCSPFLRQLSRLAVTSDSSGKTWPTEGANRPAPKTGRNDPCPCGSGKKFKKCCLGKR